MDTTPLLEQIQKLKEELQIVNNKYYHSRYELKDCQLEISVLKSQLQSYQHIQCGRLYQRRQLALAQHQLDYQIKTGRISSNKDRASDLSLDYDTID